MDINAISGSIDLWCNKLKWVPFIILPCCMQLCKKTNIATLCFRLVIILATGVREGMKDVFLFTIS